jgi:hypothetical protein
VLISRLKNRAAFRAATCIFLVFSLASCDQSLKDQASSPTAPQATGSATPIPATPTEAKTSTPEPSPTPSIPEYYPGAAPAWDQFPDVGGMEKIIELARYFASLPPVVTGDQYVPFGIGEYSDTSRIAVWCFGPAINNCKILASARAGDRHFIYIQTIGADNKPHNLLGYLGPLNIGEESLMKILPRLALPEGFQLNVVTRIKYPFPHYTNPYIYELTVGSNEPLSENIQLLMEGTISPGLEETPLWIIPTR